MPTSRDEYTQANRQAWNEVAPRHARHNNAELFELFRNPDYVDFKGAVLDALLQVGVRDKAIIQLCCNNARETVSLRNMGARYCVGVDGAEDFLAQGQELIKIAGAQDQVKLVHSDIYYLPDELIGAFDVALITIGVISWMPDLQGFFNAVQSVLKPGGFLVLEDMHPVLFMYDENPDGGPSSIHTSHIQ